MRIVSKKFVFLAVVLTNLIVVPQLYAADQNDHATAITLNASDIQFKPAPGFPKGAQIALIRGDLSKPMLYTIRFKLPDGFIIPAHWHPKDEEVTVLSGTLNVGMGDTVDKSKSTALSAGGYQIVPANAHHYVWANGETVFQVEGMGPRSTTFVNPKEWAAMIQKSNQ